MGLAGQVQQPLLNPVSVFVQVYDVDVTVHMGDPFIACCTRSVHSIKLSAPVSMHGDGLSGLCAVLCCAVY